MFVGTLPADQIVLPGASKETHIVLRSVRSSILQETDHTLRFYPSADINWQELKNLAMQNKLAVLLLRGFNRNANQIPMDVRGTLENCQRATLQSNAINLVTLRHMIPKLRSHGINPVVFKGPVAQKLIYGDFFAKPSLDLDLLVFPREYNTASRLIENNGFTLADECSSTWWTFFLGEQHFFSNDSSQIQIDLHYRTQQPGCPTPYRPELFMSKLLSVDVGTSQIRTLSITNTCLLSCMNLVKALIHREPAGGHVCDIAANVLGNRPEELMQLFDDASRQGLRNTLLLGLRSSALLFGIQVRSESGAVENILQDTTNANLLNMILFPSSSETHWRKRSKMLWDLCDHKSAYLRAASWKLGGELCRLYFSRPHRILSPMN